MSLGPFDLTGGPFLTLYAGLLVVTIVSGFLIPSWLRPDGLSGRVRDPDRLAFLAGGATRFADALTVRLLARGAISITDKQKFWFDGRGSGRTEAERAVLALDAPARWTQVSRAARTSARTSQRQLVDAGLLLDSGTALQLRFWQTTPYLLLLVFGTTKWVIGDMRDKPVGFLTALLVVTAVLALIRFATLNRRTRAGNEALAAAKVEAERVRRAPTSDEAGLAVALFGTAVLVGSPWDDFHQLRAASGGDGGSSSDGSSSVGCGGGGCGGCGGG